jgi:CheY-like chemotaxis protein
MDGEREKRARILVIEDDLANLRLITILLKNAGHEVIGEMSGEDGLAAARRAPPDLILCDGHLPGMDGFGVVREVRNDAELRAIPVVAVTGLARTEDREALLAAGFDGYIPKPFDIKDFARQATAFLAR